MFVFAKVDISRLLQPSFELSHSINIENLERFSCHRGLILSLNLSVNSLQTYTTTIIYDFLRFIPGTNQDFFIENCIQKWRQSWRETSNLEPIEMWFNIVRYDSNSNTCFFSLILIKSPTPCCISGSFLFTALVGLLRIWRAFKPWSHFLKPIQIREIITMTVKSARTRRLQSNVCSSNCLLSSSTCKQRVFSQAAVSDLICSDRPRQNMCMLRPAKTEIIYVQTSWIQQSPCQDFQEFQIKIRALHYWAFRRLKIIACSTIIYVQTFACLKHIFVRSWIDSFEILVVFVYIISVKLYFLKHNRLSSGPGVFQIAKETKNWIWTTPRVNGIWKETISLACLGKNIILSYWIWDVFATILFDNKWVFGGPRSFSMWTKFVMEYSYCKWSLTQK